MYYSFVEFNSPRYQGKSRDPRQNMLKQLLKYYGISRVKVGKILIAERKVDRFRQTIEQLREHFSGWVQYSVL